MFITKRLYEKPDKNTDLKQLIDLSKEDEILKLRDENGFPARSGWRRR
ncbi:hypothetical protein [Candidatus Scalindua japonica]|nr:hypothetical protein [Candidatus Scalindua japonica]